MGKLIGGLIGFLIFNIFGLILGIFIGHSYDKRNEAGFAGFGGQPHPQAQQLFFETLFRLLGHLAKADGRVSEEEIKTAEEMMRQSGLTAEHRKQAIELFNQGVTQDFDLERQMQDFLLACGRNNRLKQTLLVYLITMANADGTIDQSEHAILKRVAQHLSIPNILLEQLIRMVSAQAHFGSSGYSGGQSGYQRQSRPSQSELDLAYQALGVTAQDSDQTIKRAYRKLMSENHPDKLVGQGVPEDMIKMAEERSKEISRAYDIIKESRK